MSMKKEEIREVVKETIHELQKKSLIKTEEGYKEIAKKLYCYYERGECDEEIRKALHNVCDDKYFSIIPLFFKKKKTIADIAEQLNVDNSTVIRNKRRLCLHIYIQCL